MGILFFSDFQPGLDPVLGVFPQLFTHVSSHGVAENCGIDIAMCPAVTGVVVQHHFIYRGR